MSRIILLVITLCLYQCAPTDLKAMERFPIVTTQELVRLLEQRKAGKTDFILAHTLGELIFRNQSIPGSINLPWNKARDLGRQRLGQNLDRLVITYCMGYR